MSRELYLGRTVEDREPLKLDPDQFVTHGVILGMTGSGKTGLAIGLLEEMVQAKVPVIAIDPKGDLPNLGLLFPEFEESSYGSWCDPSEAKRAGVTTAELAREKAKAWKSGLSDWGLNGDDVRKLRDQLDLRVFTPGASKVRPVNLLGSFHPPGDDLPPDAQGDVAEGLVSGLLALVADGVDPLRDPRHVLLTQILTNAWSDGKALTLEELIGRLVDPPFPKVGVFPVDQFLSPDDRLKLAMSLNNLVASASFAAWKQGESLDLDKLLQGEGQKTPVNIFSLAHLSERERQFFVARLMSEILTWSRGLSGSSSLRAFIYFDEVAGYLPPHPHNPPSKKPILTMLKQSRAVGVGLCLATQNPVDLDYKALSNMGTWMLGRMQTEQDRNRVRDGLISASGGLNAQEVEAQLSKVQPRTFLLKSPKEEKPELFETRWVMSYLKGPITLNELPELAGTPLSNESEEEASSKEGQAEAPYLQAPPPVPKGYEQSFLDPRYVFHTRLDGFFEEHQEQARGDGKILHRPALRAVFQLQFDERKDNFVVHQRHHFVAFPINNPQGIEARFESLNFEDDDFLGEAAPEAVFTELPVDFDEAHELKATEKALSAHLYRTLTATRYVNEKVKLYSKPEETREEFLERCREEASDLADQAVVKLRDKLEKQMSGLEKKLLKKRDDLERLALTEKGRKLRGLWDAGKMILGMFTKTRKSFGSVLNSSRMAMEADTRTRQAETELERLEQELRELQENIESQTEVIEKEHADLAEMIEERGVRLDKSDINVERFEILWIPVSRRV